MKRWAKNKPWFQKLLFIIRVNYITTSTNNVKHKTVKKVNISIEINL